MKRSFLDSRLKRIYFRVEECGVVLMTPAVPDRAQNVDQPPIRLERDGGEQGGDY
jgi:hypothetical protein